MGNGMGGGGGRRRGRVSVNVQNATDVWNFRHQQTNIPFVDSINSGLRTLDNDFPGFADGINTVDAVTLKGRGKNTVLGYWDSQSKQLGMNTNYTDVQKMNTIMDDAAKSGFHPSRGGKTGTEAVALHEGGHALTDFLAQKHGKAGLHELSQEVVEKAMKATNAKGGAKAFAGTISGYAKTNYAECVAEAVADWYCNGSKASNSSKAIISVLKTY